MKTGFPIAAFLISTLIFPLPAMARDHGSRAGSRGGGEWHGNNRSFGGRRFYGSHSTVILGFYDAPFYYRDYYGPYDYPYYSRSVYRGREVGADQGSLAGDVQEELADRGYYRGEIDGLVGPMTRRAIQNYQRDHDLPTTGRIDARLARSLRLN